MAKVIHINGRGETVTFEGSEAECIGEANRSNKVYGFVSGVRVVQLDDETRMTAHECMTIGTLANPY